MFNYIERTADELFNTGFNFPNVHTVSFLRGYDVYEKGGSIFLELKVPGFSKKDVSVDLEDQVLHIVADSDDRDELGFRSNVINKKFNLPKNSDEDSITASVKDGLLTVEIPTKVKKSKIKVK